MSDNVSFEAVATQENHVESMNKNFLVAGLALAAGTASGVFTADQIQHYAQQAYFINHGIESMVGFAATAASFATSALAFGRGLDHQQAALSSPSP